MSKTPKDVIVIICTTIFILFSQNNYSLASENIIPSSRRVNWDPGLPNGIPDYPVGSNVKDFGAVGNGITDETQAFKNAIAATPKGNALLIPAGTYKITATLNINKGIALRGEGHTLTKLKFDFNSGSCINVQGGSSSWINMSAGYNKDSYSITVSSTSGFNIGDFIEINQKNDPADYQDGSKGHWEDACVGQILIIKNIVGNTLTLNRGLYYTYNGSYNPQVRKIKMVEGVGVERLYLERLNSTGYGSNIDFTKAASCWVREVWSEKTLTAHIFLATAYRNEIRDSYFDDSHLHGTGGQGYGVRLEGRSTDNLIENNIFERLRHSMLVQQGATGNVFGYNYSKDPFLEEGNNWLMPDISVHGHYAYMNLFEGNTAQRFEIDNTWGTNGPTTFFRNRAEKDVSHYLDNTEKFAFIKVERNNPFHNIVGNELGLSTTYSNNPIEIDSSIASTIIVHGNYNYQDSNIEWDPDIPDHNLPDSYYLDSKPSWFDSLSWPPIGGDISPNTNLIPAQKRYQEGNYIPGPTTTAAATPDNNLAPPKNLHIIY